MKRLLIGLLALSIASTSFGSTTCEDLYEYDVWNSLDFSEDNADKVVKLKGWANGTSLAGFAFSGIIGAATATEGMLLPIVLAGTAAGPVVILAGIGATAGVIAIHNHKPNKMIKLINESERYSRVQGTPGKQLRKLYKKLDQKYSLKELADHISKGNKDQSLCSTDNVSFRKLKKMIKNGDIKLITNE